MTEPAQSNVNKTLGLMVLGFLGVLVIGALIAYYLFNR